MIQKAKNKNKDIKGKNIYKIMLIGDSAPGKTCFLLRCTGWLFPEYHAITIGLDYRMKEMQIEEGQTIKLQIQDTPGQERFYVIGRNYYHAADGFILIYEITDKYSFNFVRNWIKKYKGDLLEKAPIFLIGNKIDREENRKVTTEEGILFAKEHGCIFYECSAKSFINIDSIVNGIAKKIHDNYKRISD